MQIDNNNADIPKNEGNVGEMCKLNGPIEEHICASAVVSGSKWLGVQECKAAQSCWASGILPMSWQAAMFLEAGNTKTSQLPAV